MKPTVTLELDDYNSLWDERDGLVKRIRVIESSLKRVFNIDLEELGDRSDKIREQEDRSRLFDLQMRVAE